MLSKEEYKKILSEIIQKQAKLLGLPVAISRVKNVPEIKLSENGEVKDVVGNEEMVLQKLVNEFVYLSGEIVKNTINTVFQRYAYLKN